jgi:hypothetical protein
MEKTIPALLFMGRMETEKQGCNLAAFMARLYQKPGSKATVRGRCRAW